MNPIIETAIIISAVALAAVFLIMRFVKNIGGKGLSCCSSPSKKACPRCPDRRQPVKKADS